MELFRIMFLLVLLIIAITSVISCSGGKSETEKAMEDYEKTVEQANQLMNKTMENVGKAMEHVNQYANETEKAMQKIQWVF